MRRGGLFRGTTSPAHRHLSRRAAPFAPLPETRPVRRHEQNMYATVKRVAEELRALSFEFEIPVVSVSQINREGMFVNFDSLDFNYIAESLGVPATADFMAILGTDEDNMIYENEVLYKITKNRLGGRVGQFDKFYLDARSLKMYDSCELDEWLADAEISGDDRTNIDHDALEEERGNRRGGRRR